MSLVRFFNLNTFISQRELKQLMTISKPLKDILTYGKIISVRGSVVDVFFENNLPPIYTLLHTRKDKEIAVEVLTALWISPTFIFLSYGRITTVNRKRYSKR